ncbi:hypothetical protein [Pseudonocardia sp. UM4_GMWB1]|uniref:hypothetical protein n=1 Tax=Pseudonocardia sp. UM4_GMWB1 TaxID=2212989 RepID=UPI00307FBDB5
MTAVDLGALVAALRAVVVRAGGCWSGPASDLLAVLGPAPVPAPSWWPSGPASLGILLRRHGEALAEAGVLVRRRRLDGVRILVVTSGVGR